MRQRHQVLIVLSQGTQCDQEAVVRAQEHAGAVVVGGGCGGARPHHHAGRLVLDTLQDDIQAAEVKTRNMDYSSVSYRHIAMSRSFRRCVVYRRCDSLPVCMLTQVV